MNAYLKQKVMNFCIWIYMFYRRLWEFFLNHFGPIYILYYYDGKKFMNLTLRYYLTYCYKKYTCGSYFCRIYGSDYVNNFIYSGQLRDVRMIKLPIIKPRLKRKNLIFYDNKKTLTVNLNVLDDYMLNMQSINATDDSNIPTKLIFDLLGLNCSHVHIITMKPYSKIIKPIHELKIAELYEL